MRKFSTRVKGMAGNRYGKLTVIRFSHVDHNGRSNWLCWCDCGGIKTVRSNALKMGMVESCGCLKGNPKHKQSYTQFYVAWTSMRKRCKSYSSYSDVEICPEWGSFENFKADMHDDYVIHVKEHGSEDTTLDRIDPFGDYSKENCRWVTWEIQRVNKRPIIRPIETHRQ